jgi:hypothetical protein
MGLKRILAAQIARWAEGIVSQSELPLFVRQLIEGSVSPVSIESIEFPAGKSVQSPGLDGRLKCKKSTSHIPQGFSAWEMSNQGTAIEKKATNILKVRTDKAIGYAPKDATFIFVTGLRCPSKHAWVKNEKKKQKKRKNKDKVWKDIKFYDADDLEHMLELAPVASVRIAKQILRIVPKDVEILDVFGEKWCYNEGCEFTHKLILTDRKEQVDVVKTWLGGNCGKMKIIATTLEEAIAFFWAVIKDMTPQEQEYYYSKSLIIDNDKDFSELASNEIPSILIYTDNKKTMSVNYATKKHHILMPVEGTSGDQINGTYIVLRPLNKDSFINAFVEIGKDYKDGSDLFEKCDGDLGILKKVLT